MKTDQANWTSRVRGVEFSHIEGDQISRMVGAVLAKLMEKILATAGSEWVKTGPRAGPRRKEGSEEPV